MTQITLLGTGLMGGPMSRNLLKAGHDLRVWNRSREKAEPLAALGAVVCDTPAEAVAGSHIVISMLSDGPASGTIQEGAMEAFAEAAIWVEMGSIKPEESRAHAARFAARGIGYVDAPVSGGTKGAEGATLAIMAGGDAATFAKVAAVLSDLGRPVHVGPVGAGQLSKLANQAIVACTIGAVAEAMLLLERGGANPAAVRDALRGGFADSTILQQHGQRMTDGNFVPGGLTKFQIKDLDNTLAEAEGLGLTLPTVQAINDRFKVLRDEMAGGDMDHSALFLQLKALNNLV